MTARHILKNLKIKNQKSKLATSHPERQRPRAASSFSGGARIPKSSSQNFQNSPVILALGSEFDTRLALFIDNKIYFSENTGEIAKNPEDLEKFILEFLYNIPISSIISPSLSVIPAKAGIQSPNIIPNIIITDLHPLYNSTRIGKKLAKKFSAQYLQLQHHLAHIFTAFGDYLNCTHYLLPVTRYPIVGIACDGTGYGFDGKIWGGEVFYGQKRVGHLEEQTLIGGDLSIQEPARMLISLLSKIYSKKDIFPFIKKYYSKKNFEVIYSQLAQNFNCQQTTSASRILDAISILLGFCKNTREYKHYAAKMIEKNSLPTTKYLEPKIQTNGSGEKILETTRLIKYIADALSVIPAKARIQPLLLNKEFATLAQTYIINGLCQIAKTHCNPENNLPIFLSGGLADNKIFRDFAAQRNIYIPQNFSPGDDSIAAGQIFWYLLN